MSYKKRPPGARKGGPYDAKGFLKKIPTLSGTPLAAYTLTADVGTFALVGEPVTIIANRSLLLSGGVGVFALSGPTTNIQVARSVVASVGVFALVGPTMNLKTARSIVAAGGVFSEIGESDNLLQVRRLIAQAGVFSITNVVTAIRDQYTLKADTGTFSFTGFSADISTGEEELPVIPLFSSYSGGGGGRQTSSTKVVDWPDDPLRRVVLQAGTGYFRCRGQEVLFQLTKHTVSDKDLAQLSALIRAEARHKETMEFAVLLTHIRL